MRNRNDITSLLALPLALSLPAPAGAGVLPDDRADALYHRYDGGGVTVDGPSMLVRKKFGENFSVAANYYVDMVSSASIDVVTQASPYKETRTPGEPGRRHAERQDTVHRSATPTATRTTTPRTPRAST